MTQWLGCWTCITNLGSVYAVAIYFFLGSDYTVRKIVSVRCSSSLNRNSTPQRIALPMHKLPVGYVASDSNAATSRGSIASIGYYVKLDRSSYVVQPSRSTVFGTRLFDPNVALDTVKIN